MPDQNPTLEYGKGTPRYSPRRLAVALSIVIGVAVTITSLCCFLAIAGIDSVSSFILGLAYDKHGVLFLPPLTIVGIAAGIIAWIKSRSTAAIFGIVLSTIAFFASMGVGAIDVVIYFQRH